MATYDPGGDGLRLVQAARGADEAIGSRYTMDGEHWSSWVTYQATISAINLAVFDPGDGARMVYAFRDQNGNVVTRMLAGWTRSGTTLDAVGLAVFDPGDGSRLYQAVRDENEYVSFRHTLDGEDWTDWERINRGSTLNPVTLAVFNPGGGKGVP